MAKVAREMVEKTGVDVDKLLELLVKNAAADQIYQIRLKKITKLLNT